MDVLVIDAQGGGMGKAIVSAVRKNFPSADITAVGANSTASAVMLKAGADRAATGENPVIVACRDTDVIIGPIGIIIADSLLGEITPAMAAAVAQSRAKRILIPVNHCDNIVAGVPDLSLGRLIQDAVDQISRLFPEGAPR